MILPAPHAYKCDRGSWKNSKINSFQRDFWPVDLPPGMLLSHMCARPRLITLYARAPQEPTVRMIRGCVFHCATFLRRKTTRKFIFFLFLVYAQCELCEVGWLWNVVTIKMDRDLDSSFALVKILLCPIVFVKIMYCHIDRKKYCFCTLLDVDCYDSKKSILLILDRIISTDIQTAS